MPRPADMHVALFGMDHLDDIRRRMRLANLEARRETHEIERDALTRKIDSPRTSVTPDDQFCCTRSARSAQTNGLLLRALRVL